MERKSSSFGIIRSCNAFHIPNAFPYHHHDRRRIIQQKPLSSSCKPRAAAAFSTSSSFSSSASSSSSSSLTAAPRRLEDNVDGPLYVNEKCINCAACSMFAPEIFERNNIANTNTKNKNNNGHNHNHHIVYKQPTASIEIDNSRAAMMGCPVAAIRFETNAYRNHNNLPGLSSQEKQLTKQLAINPKLNGLDMPFPRPMITTSSTTTTTTTTKATKKDQNQQQQHEVYYVGYHNEKSFGAIPYLVYSQTHKAWIMIDTPKFTKSAIDAITSITGSDGNGPSYLLLTHIDDTDGHDQWKNHFSNLKRIIHIGDLSSDSNWRKDDTLNDVEIILQEESTDNVLQFFTIDGRPVSKEQTDDLDDDVYIVHTPGHTAGSITLWKKYIGDSDGDSGGILFTGDTYAYTTRNKGKMTGFVQYCKQDPILQSKVIKNLITTISPNIIAPGHGHPKFYTSEQIIEGIIPQNDVNEAMEELINHGTKCGLL